VSAARQRLLEQLLAKLDVEVLDEDDPRFTVAEKAYRKGWNDRSRALRRELQAAADSGTGTLHIGPHPREWRAG